MNVRVTTGWMFGLAVSAFGLSACSANDEIGGGFELVDGGGSKISLTRDGLVMINYTVTGLGGFGDYAVIESRAYNASRCSYFLLNLKTQKVVLVKSWNGAKKMIDSVNALNQRSCKTKT